MHASIELVNKVNKQFSDKIAAPPFDDLRTANLQKKCFIDKLHLVVRKYIELWNNVYTNAHTYFRKQYSAN